MKQLQFPKIEGTEAFTPVRLREISARWEAITMSCGKPGSEHPDIDLWTAAHRMEQASGIAAYMERECIVSSRNIGCFQLDFINKGDIVRVRKGTKIATCHPRKRNVMGRTHNVTVHRANGGYTDNLYKHHKTVVSKPHVTWAGSSGYWFWADIDDVEIVQRAVVAA